MATLSFEQQKKTLTKKYEKREKKLLYATVAGCALSVACMIGPIIKSEYAKKDYKNAHPGVEKLILDHDAFANAQGALHAAQRSASSLLDGQSQSNLGNIVTDIGNTIASIEKDPDFLGYRALEFEIKHDIFPFFVGGIAGYLAFIIGYFSIHTCNRKNEAREFLAVLGTQGIRTFEG